MSAVLEAREPSARYLEAAQPALVRQFELLATAPGGVARLREFILSLAVQGKLTVQDCDEEPASALLERIRDRKLRSIASGAIKQGKQPLEWDDAAPMFELPKGWTWARLGELCSYIQRGKGPAYAEQSEHKVISQKCVRWYGLDLTPAKFVTPESLAKYEPVRFLRAGDLLWNSTGTGTIGRACVVPNELDEAGLVADSHVTVVRPLEVNSVFLWRWIQSPFVQDEIEGSASGTTNQIELNTSTVVSQLVPLPPLAEQARIVDRVDELMRLCDSLEAKGRLEAEQHAHLLGTLLGTLTDSGTPDELAAHWQRVADHFDLLFDRPEAVDVLEQTILQLAVRGLLVPQDPQDEPASLLLHKIRAERNRLIGEGKLKRDKPLSPIADTPFDLPQGWQWVRMQEAFDVRDGTHDTPKYVERDGVPLITSRNFECGRISFEDAKLISRADHELIMRRSRVERFDVLYSMIGGNIGNQVLVDTDREFSIKNVALFKYVSRSCTSPFYLNLFLETVTLGMQSQAVGGAQPFVSLSVLRNIPFPLPPISEQARIVARVTELRRLCAALRQRLDRSRTTQASLADALIEQALSA